MYHNILLDFLDYYECDPQLLLYVILCKGELEERTGYSSKVINIETSIKYQADGKIIKGRYVITINIDELLKYKKEFVKEMFEYVGFDFDSFNFEKNPKIDYIYIGVDGNKGKIYVGNSNSGICYESNGNIKYYMLTGKDLVDIYIDKETTTLGAIHLRIKNNEIVNWYGISKNFITIYYRPNLNGYEIDRDILQKSNIWYYHKCICKKCYESPPKGKNIEDLIPIINKMNAWYIIKLYLIIYKIIELVSF